MTRQWPNHVFCFLLAVTIVNIENVGTYFLEHERMDSMQSRKLIAEQVIYNQYLRTGMAPKKQSKWGSIEHSLIMVPVCKKFLLGCKKKKGNGNALIAVGLYVEIYP